MKAAHRQSEKGRSGFHLHRLAPVLARRAANRRAGQPLGGSNEQEKNLRDLCAWDMAARWGKVRAWPMPQGVLVTCSPCGAWAAYGSLPKEPKGQLQ
jgi:hypothetical protein